MDFEQRLQKAIERGQHRKNERGREAAQQEMTEDELRQLHTSARLELSEKIETGLKKLADHFPGFQSETMFGDRGWGAACSRDDLGPGMDGKRASYYSRLEMTIRPYSDLNVVELTSKGTIRNKELFNRTHFEEIKDVDEETFITLIDAWVLEYAEQFAAVS